MYQPHTLTLVTTYICTAACEHCCFSCSPERKEKMSLQDMKKYIRDAYDIPSIRLIVFTGGECFTLGDDLFKAIKYADDLGFATRCVSNGYWAKSVVSAQKWLNKIKKAGLTELNFSTGDHHAAHIPITHVLNGVEVACKNKVVVAVNLELFEGSKTKAYLKSIFRSYKKRYPNLLHINHGVWIPNGGKTELKHNKEYKRKRSKRFKGCDSIFNSLSVKPNGEINACCGLYSNHIPEMHLGDLSKNSLDEILNNNRDRDIIKIALAVDGPEAVLNYAKNYDPKIEIKENFVHPCQTCLQLYKNRKDREAIEKACREHEDRIYGTYRIANDLETYVMGYDSMHGLSVSQ